MKKHKEKIALISVLVCVAGLYAHIWACLPILLATILVFIISEI
jgi:hypothetical protein